jgi:PII-like signaling protein
MLTHGPAKRVTICVGEDVHHHGEALYMVVLNFLFYRGVAGATITKGIAGFGADHKLHTNRILRLAENLPIRIEFVETADKLELLLPRLYELAGPGIIDVQDTMVVKPPTEKEAAAPELPHVALKGRAKLMRIYIGEDDTWHGKPLHEAITESLRANDLAGATIYRGIYGYGAHRRFHREKALARSHDLPIMLSVIDEEAKIRNYLPLLDEMVSEGLVVLSDVDVIRYTHRVPAEAV